MLLRRRLLLLFVAMLTGFMASGIAVALVFRTRDDAQARERVLEVASERVAQLGTAYSDEESGERGFVITGDETFLAPYVTGSQQARALADQLRDAFDGRAELTSALDRVVAASSAWKARSAAVEIATRRAQGGEAALALVQRGDGKGRFDVLRAQLDSLDRALTSETVAARHHLDDVRHDLTLLFVGIAVVAALGTVSAALLIRRWVTRPIERLASDVQHVREGSLDAPIAPVGSPELAALASAVDAMRNRIRAQLVESERSRTAVEQSAAVVLALRAQLEPDLQELPAGWTVSGQVRAAEGVVAGDCFDLFTIGPDALGLVVIDIAGHGAVEGILALRCREILRTSLTERNEPGAAIHTVAEQLGDMGSETFLTAFVASIDVGDGTMRFANAGHPPAIVVSADSHRELLPTGPLVGPLPLGWGTETTHLHPGDMLCAFTDGVTEVRNSERDFFGEERLIELMAHTRCEEAPVVVKRCLDEIQLFAPGGLHDDATIVVLCRSEAH